MSSFQGNKLAKILTVFGAVCPLIAAAAQLIFSQNDNLGVGITVYGPYVSAGSSENPPILIGFGFFIVLTLANLLVAFGLKALGSTTNYSRLSLLGGLIVPVILELAGLFRTIILSSASIEMPRRYHYYYFAPETSTVWQNAWVTFVPGSMLPVIAHAISLVFLVLGYSVGTQNSAST